MAEKRRGNGQICSVAHCTNYRGKTEDVSYFMFPRDPVLREEWIKKCGKRDCTFEPKNFHSVCSMHFQEEDFERDLRAELMNIKPRRSLRKGSVPSKNLPQPKRSRNVKKKIENDMENYMQYKLTDQVGQLKLKSGVLPHRFDCQNKTTRQNVKILPKISVKKAVPEARLNFSALTPEADSSDETDSCVEDCEPSFELNLNTLYKTVKPEPEVSSEDRLNPQTLISEADPCTETDSLVKDSESSVHKTLHVRHITGKKVTKNGKSSSLYPTTKFSGCCAAKGCSMRAKTNLLSKVKMYKFPKNPELRKLWEKATRRKVGPSQVLCSHHFITGKPSKDPLHPDYVPSVFHWSGKKGGTQKQVDRYQRQMKRWNASSQPDHDGVKLVNKFKIPPCSVPGCKSNSTVEGPHVKIFNFPTKEPERTQWLQAINRKNFVPTQNSKVCVKHFKSSDLVTERVGYDKEKNELIRTPIEPILKWGAVPSVACQVTRPSPTASKLKTITAQEKESNSVTKFRKILPVPTIVKLNYNACSEDIEMMESTDFTSLAELEKKQNLLDLSDFWTFAKGKTSIAFLHIKWTHAPKIHLSVVVDENLSVSVFYGDDKIKATKTFSFPTTVKSIVELDLILKETKERVFTEIETTRNIELVKRLLYSLQESIKKDRVTFSFLKEQVSLLTDQEKNYSSEMLTFATLLFSMAPHAYKFLIQCENFVLPELDIIKNLYVQLQTSPHQRVSPIQFLKNAKENFFSLSDSDKRVVIQMEEIYLKPYYKIDENIAGMSIDIENAATSVVIFMITSLCSDYKDTVHVLPVRSLKAKEIHDVLKEVIIGLECIGFSIIAVVTDNSLANKHVMSFFCDPPVFNSIVYKHPNHSTRPLFHLISCAHLLKSVRNDWMRQNNPSECFHYPPIGNGTDNQLFKIASFSTLKKLHEVETRSHLKYFSCFSAKAISPPRSERHDIELVLQIFNDGVADRLLLYGEDQKLSNYQDTADFIKLICTWWSIVNPKSPLKEGYNSQSNISLSMSDKSYDFLQKFLDWLDCWSNVKYDSGTLTAKTHSSLYHTTYALIELTAYCKNELGMDFILPGNFQTDYRITRFGSCRELPGIQFFPKKRWVKYESKLKDLNSLSLSLIEHNDVNLTRLQWKETVNLKEDIDLVKTFIPMIITTKDMTLSEVNMAVLLYLGGHCAHSVLKELNCQQCKTHLLTDVNMALHPSVSDITENSLQYPSKNSMSIVHMSFIVLSKLCKEYASEFWNHSNQKPLAFSLTMNILENIEFDVDYQFCGNGHSAIQAMRMIVRSVVYTVLSNHDQRGDMEVQNDASLFESFLTTAVEFVNC